MLEALFAGTDPGGHMNPGKIVGTDGPARAHGQPPPLDWPADGRRSVLDPGSIEARD
jgi:hypothetical protein